MGRKSTISDPSVFAAVGKEVARSGRLTMDALRAATGISTGSVYHRYQSREGLLARTWLFALQKFHQEFVAALDVAGAFPGEMAALVTPRFARAHRDEAVILACGSVNQFTSEQAPHNIMARIHESNERTRSAMRLFAQRHGFSLLSCRLALAAYPLATVKLYLPDQPVPESVDAYVRRACKATLERVSE